MDLIPTDSFGLSLTTRRRITGQQNVVRVIKYKFNATRPSGLTPKDGRSKGTVPTLHIPVGGIHTVRIPVSILDKENSSTEFKKTKETEQEQ